MLLIMNFKECYLLFGIVFIEFSYVAHNIISVSALG